MIESNLLHRFIAIFFLPFLIFIRLISPFYTIRLKTFLSERIGHFISDAGISLCEKIDGQKYEDIYWFNTPSCNTQLEKMVKRVFFVRWWVRYLLIANKVTPSQWANSTNLESRGGLNKYLLNNTLFKRLWSDFVAV